MRAPPTFLSLLAKAEGAAGTRPVAVILAGHNGSGKSTLSRRIRPFRLPVCSQDPMSSSTAGTRPSKCLRSCAAVRPCGWTRWWGSGQGHDAEFPRLLACGRTRGMRGRLVQPTVICRYLANTRFTGLSSPAIPGWWIFASSQWMRRLCGVSGLRTSRPMP